MASAFAKAAASRRAKVNVNKNYAPGSFSFAKSGRSTAYRGAAKSALKGGKSVMAAHRAGMAAHNSNAARVDAGGNSGASQAT